MDDDTCFQAGSPHKTPPSSLRSCSRGPPALLVAHTAPLVVGPHGQAHEILVLEAGLALHLPVPGPEGISQPLHLQGKKYRIERTDVINLF